MKVLLRGGELDGETAEGYEDEILLYFFPPGTLDHPNDEACGHARYKFGYVPGPGAIACRYRRVDETSPDGLTVYVFVSPEMTEA